MNGEAIPIYREAWGVSRLKFWGGKLWFSMSPKMRQKQDFVAKGGSSVTYNSSLIPLFCRKTCFWWDKVAHTPAEVHLDCINFELCFLGFFGLLAHVLLYTHLGLHLVLQSVIAYSLFRWEGNIQGLMTWWMDWRVLVGLALQHASWDGMNFALGSIKIGLWILKKN